MKQKTIKSKQGSLDWRFLIVTNREKACRISKLGQFVRSERRVCQNKKMCLKKIKTKIALCNLLKILGTLVASSRPMTIEGIALVN